MILNTTKIGHSPRSDNGILVRATTIDTEQASCPGSLTTPHISSAAQTGVLSVLHRWANDTGGQFCVRELEL